MHKKRSPLLSNDLLRRITTYASVTVAVLLIVAKIIAWQMTGSVALLSSLVDSGVDLLASLITAYGVHVALRPPDRDHRFGHGKAEPLAALAQAVFIFVSSGFLVKEAVTRFIDPVPLEHLEVGYGVMAFAVVLTLLLLALQAYTIRRTRSLAIASDRLHYVGDVLINLAVIVTFLLQDRFAMPLADPLFAIVIAGAMCVGATKIARRALGILMDAEVDGGAREKIIEAARGVKNVRGVHDVRTRMDGGRLVIEAHVEMDATLTLAQAHVITEKVESVLEALFPDSDVLIHQDPAGVKEKRRDQEIERNDPGVGGWHA